MPGSGKSTVGRHLARLLGWRFIDSDHEIERQIGGPIRAYFEQHGEAAFRDLEQQSIADLSQQTGAVLATGGGAVLREANRLALKSGCEVVSCGPRPRSCFAACAMTPSARCCRSGTRCGACVICTESVIRCTATPPTL